jgi:hypothetical protein
MFDQVPLPKSLSINDLRFYRDVLPSILAVYCGERWTGFGGMPSSETEVG